MNYRAMTVIFMVGSFLTAIGCDIDPVEKCYKNDECIEGYLCNKENQCIKVEQENLEILTSSLVDAVVGEAYLEELSLRGGLAPYTWSIVSGPGWLSVNSNTGELFGTPESYQKEGVLVEIEVMDDSINDGQKVTKDNLSIRSLYCLSNEACSDHGTCNTDGACECSVGHAGDQCELCAVDYELNDKGECVRYEYKCKPGEPADACGAGVLKCECIGEECEGDEDCETVLGCDKDYVCWVDGTNYGCDDCQGTGCTDGVCNGCTTGACCDIDGKMKPDTEQCDSWTEYQCSSAACGASAQLRTVEKYCSGTTSDCNGDEIPGGWSNFQQCDVLTAICENDGSASASCITCGPNRACEEGKCQDSCYIITFNDSVLEAKVRQAISKPEGEIFYNDIIRLTNLSATWQEITDLEGIQCLTNLTSLDLGGNQIINISALANLTNLTNLIFGYNQIIDISVLASLTNLTYLHFSNNQIINISALANLTNLTYANFYNNKISDISPLVENTGIDSGDNVYIKDNPINCTDQASNIQTLLNRGVDLNTDCP